MNRWGNRFSEDVGWLFEAHVGRQLALMHGATVYPSIRYGRHNGDESVDWIAVFGDVVLLVEVKSRRPTEAVRTGSDRATEDLQVGLRKAINQLSTTADLVTQRNSAFSSIPHDRPMIGLVLAMEPFYTINARPFRELLPPTGLPAPTSLNDS